MSKKSGPVLYLSTCSNTMVAFDEIAKESRHGILPYKPEHFKEGKLYIDPDKDYGVRRGKGKDIIRRMENHPANRCNGGNLFYQVDQNARDVMEFQGGNQVARAPVGGIKKPLKTQLEELYMAAADGYDSDSHDLLIDEISVIFDTFSVMGLLKPEKTFDQMRVRARLVDFFGVLEERDIWTPPKKLEEKAKK